MGIECVRGDLNRCIGDRARESIPFPFKAPDPVLSEEDPRVTIGCAVEIWKRKTLKMNVDKSKVRVLGGEEVSGCSFSVDGRRLEHVLEFKYLRVVFDESGTDGTERWRKVVSGGKFAGLIVNARS